MATAIMANETEIANAMDALGLGNWTSDVLEEIELDRELQLGIEEIERGETITLKELERRVSEKVANGYYRR